MRGGSRKAIAKKRVPSAKVKTRMYATLSIVVFPTYFPTIISVPSYKKEWSREVELKDWDEEEIFPFPVASP
jgi:hypothetical protein